MVQSTNLKSLLNETDPNNVIDMTEEVIEEKDEHHVFYELVGDGISYAKCPEIH